MDSLEFIERLQTFVAEVAAVSIEQWESIQQINGSVATLDTAAQSNLQMPSSLTCSEISCDDR